ncbi:MAG: efflux RND transporter periplasmic adaptor subunit [Saprospirales bacterium]|nr:efflux RND transporter periplasmic adaptor subunit [Saprospirales bacterium]
MRKLKINRTTLITAAAMLLAGILLGWLVRPSTSEETHMDHGAEASSPSRETTWTCSMHPQIRQQEPGKCPLCGMDLIPLDDNQSEEGPMELNMSPTAMQLANVQTAVVGFGTASRDVRMNGKVQPDERLRYSQVSHLTGRVEQLYVNFTGEQVQKGQKLASIYSPELVTAQEELFSAQKIKDVQPGLFSAAKEKLKNWKLSDSQIEDILAAGKPQEQFPIQADVNGVVLKKNINLGDYLMRGMALYEVADLSRVWVLFDVYENDMPWIRVGSTVQFTVQSLPGKSFSGMVTFIDPVIDPATRVATARVEVSNPGFQLKPEMFASGLVHTQLTSQKEKLFIPKSAVMWTGKRSVVYVKNEKESGVSFQLREVVLGALTGQGYLIDEGLDPGEEVAVNGTFSIDAAAQLAGKPSMMNAHKNRLEAGKAAKDAVQKLFPAYLALKDALVLDDLVTSLKQADILKKQFIGTNRALFTGAAHQLWMNADNAAEKALSQMLFAKDVEEARMQFKPLSGQMVALAKAFEPFDNTIYVQHCPMADNNTGADWLSLHEEIRNPYFGDKMLKCGKVTDTIN